MTSTTAMSSSTIFSTPSFFRPVGSEIGKLVAVVIDVLADVAEAVQLAAEADPALDDVVIIVLLGPRPGRPVWSG